MSYIDEQMASLHDIRFMSESVSLDCTLRKGRYKYLVKGHAKFDIVKKHTKSNKKYSETEIIKMLDLLTENIYLLSLLG